MTLLSIHHTGLIDEGLDHLTNALAICGQPQQLLSVLQQTLPAPIFQQLIMRLPSIQAVSNSTIQSFSTCEHSATVTTVKLG